MSEARGHLTLRSATSADAAAIARIHIASWRAAYANELPADLLASLDHDERTDLWRERIADPENLVRVIEEKQTLLAFCSSGPSHDKDAAAATWEIRNLHVSPELRGGGLGGRLFDDAVRHAQSANAQTVTLWVVETNYPARRFYEKRGMTCDGAGKLHPISDTAHLAEVRYRMSISSC